jgi:hypothetical protein
MAELLETDPPLWNSTSPLCNSCTVLESVWNSASFSLSAAPLTSARLLAF